MIQIKCNIVPHTTGTWNAILIEKHSAQFNKTFKAHLPRFMNPFTGFDVVSFSDWLCLKENESAKNTVLDRHGQDAVKMIESLMKPQPLPDPVETWTDEEFDMSSDISSKGFSRCEYSFRATGGNGFLEGNGYYKDGLIVHRGHHGGHHGYSPYEQCPNTMWCISTMQGVLLAETTSLRDAKQKAAIFALAMDWTEAQTMNMTKRQMAAAKRVWKEIS